MRKRTNLLLCLSYGLFLSLFLMGCQAKPGTEAPITIESLEQPILTPVPTETPSPTATPAEASTPAATVAPSVEATTTKTLTISVLNLSSIDIGMFAVIDPVTGEQMNVDSLKSGESVSIESNWPVDVAEFHWALYNTSGELCIDASTNISEAKKTVALLLTGEKTIEDVEVVAE